MNPSDEHYFRTKNAIDIHDLGGVAIPEDLADDAEFVGLTTTGMREEIDPHELMPNKDRTYDVAIRLVCLIQ